MADITSPTNSPTVNQDTRPGMGGFSSAVPQASLPNTKINSVSPTNPVTPSSDPNDQKLLGIGLNQDQINRLKSGNMEQNEFVSLTDAIGTKLKINNDLATQRSYLVSHLFDHPLTPDELAKLPPDMQSIVSSGDPQAIQLQIRVLNDQISGRAATLNTSIQNLTTGYDAAQKNIQTSLGQLETYATNNGLKLGDLIGAMAPIFGKGVADQLQRNLSSINYPYIKNNLQASISQENSGTLVDGYNLGTTNTLGSYATDPNQPAQVRAINDNITQQYGPISDTATANSAIQSLSPGSPVTGEMIMNAAHQYGVDPGVLMSVMQNDSNLGMKGVATSTMNPGNVGNTDSGATKSFSSWQDGVNAVAQNLAQRETTSNRVTSSPPNPSTANQVDPLTHVSPMGIYQAAIDYAFTGKMPSLGLGAGTGPATIRGKVISIAGAIAADQGLTFPQMKALYTADASAAKQNVERLARVESIENSLVNQFPRLGELADKVSAAGINLTESDVQAGSAAVQAKFGSPDAASYVELLNTVRADYAAQNAALAGSRGGEFFANSAQQAIPLGYTSDQYKALSDTIYKSAENIKQGVNQEVQSLIGTSGTAGSNDKNTDAASFFQSKGIDYSALKKDYPNMSDADLISQYNSSNQ